MRLSDGLYDILKDTLRWNKPRLQCFVSLLSALLQVQCMDLSRLVHAMNDDAQLQSRYRRLQRFFQMVHFDYDAIAHLIMRMFAFDQGSFYLTLDRTNWKWGRSNINLLVIAVAYKGIAIPIYWLVLNKQGNSNQRERIALLHRFITQFGRSPIRAILGDREFIGQQWWAVLSLHSIPFLMRMKESQHYKDRQGVGRPMSQLFRDLTPGKSRVLRKPRRVSGQHIYLSAMRLPSGELLILAGNQHFSKPFEVYARRWEIETLFQALKGRGFNMEATRITHYFRIKKVVALLAIAFCWAHKTGEWRHAHIKPLKLKNHGRLEKSLFRYGLDYLADKLFAPMISLREITRLLVLFLCPPHWIKGDQTGVQIEVCGHNLIRAI